MMKGLRIALTILFGAGLLAAVIWVGSWFISDKSAERVAPVTPEEEMEPATLVDDSDEDDEDAQNADSDSDEGAETAVEVRDIAALPAGTSLTKEEVEAYGEDKCFTVSEITDEVFNRINGLSFGEDCTVPRENLRYIRVLHVDAEGTIHVGELIMNKSVADDVCDIFHELYIAGYAIEKMHLIDDYDADDNASMEDNNTSAFNYRVIAGSSEISNHAYGLAIDINPFYNPYVIPAQDYVSPTAAYEYSDRSKDFAYKIEKDDLCYQLFTERGFTWGGEWSGTIDYQHFEKEQ